MKNDKKSYVTPNVRTVLRTCSEAILTASPGATLPGVGEDLIEETY